MKVKWKSRPACCTGTTRMVPQLKDGGLEVQQGLLHAEGSGPELGLDVLEERATSAAVNLLLELDFYHRLELLLEQLTCAGAARGQQR